MVRTQQWVKLLQMANESGLSRHDWCKENGISENSFYYWQRKLRRLALDKAVDGPAAEYSQRTDSVQRQDFFEITVPDPDSPAPFRGQAGPSASGSDSAGPSESGLSLRFGEWTLDIARNFSRQALQAVLEVMRDV